jgi:hypothetical protein
MNQALSPPRLMRGLVLCSLNLRQENRAFPPKTIEGSIVFGRQGGVAKAVHLLPQKLRPLGVKDKRLTYEVHRTKIEHDFLVTV